MARVTVERLHGVDAAFLYLVGAAGDAALERAGRRARNPRHEVALAGLGHTVDGDRREIAAGASRDRRRRRDALAVERPHPRELGPDVVVAPVVWAVHPHDRALAVGTGHEEDGVLAILHERDARGWNVPSRERDRRETCKARHLVVGRKIREARACCRHPVVVGSGDGADHASSRSTSPSAFPTSRLSRSLRRSATSSGWRWPRL
jgi:hypothetical protein